MSPNLTFEISERRTVNNKAQNREEDTDEGES